MQLQLQLCVIVPGRQGKYIFTHFYLQGILNDINEQDIFLIVNTHLFDCKHKHMMKSGVPPCKVSSSAPSVTYRIPWFHNQN